MLNVYKDISIFLYYYWATKKSVVVWYYCDDNPYHLFIYMTSKCPVKILKEE